MTTPKIIIDCVDYNLAATIASAVTSALISQGIRVKIIDADISSAEFLHSQRDRLEKLVYDETKVEIHIDDSSV